MRALCPRVQADAEQVFPLDTLSNNVHALLATLINTNSTTDEDESLLVEDICLCMI